MSPMVRRPPGMELSLLGFLRQGPQHGYQIHQMVSDPHGLGSIWRIKQSQLYALLAKLEKEGYTWGQVEMQGAARPPRRMYQLTANGIIAFKNWMQSPVNVPRSIRQEFMAKLYFARKEGKAQVKILIDAQRQTCQNWLDALVDKNIEQSSFKELIFQYRIGQIRATLVWLDTCLEKCD